MDAHASKSRKDIRKKEGKRRQHGGGVRWCEEVQQALRVKKEAKRRRS